MFKKVLLPLDGSAEAESPLPYIKDFSNKFSSKVHVLGVGVGNKRRKVNRLLADYIQCTADNLAQDGILARSHMLYGHAVDQILLFIKENAIDLLVMATHGRSGVTRWWIGSIAENIVTEATIPVLLVRSKRLRETEVNKTKTFRHILVPLDGSSIGESALQYAETLALKLDAAISLLHVIHSFDGLGFDIPGYDLKIMTKKLNDSGEKYLKSISEKLKNKGIKTSSKVVVGNPATTIIEYAQEKKIDLIAMSTHGRSGITRWVLGSVADKILKESSLPLWLVRSPKMTVQKNNT